MTVNNTKIDCSNGMFAGMGYPTRAKACWCRPKTPVATTRSTQGASDYNVGGYAAPTCFITDIRLSVLGGSYTAAQLWGIGANGQLTNTLLMDAIPDYFSTPYKPKYL